MKKFKRPMALVLGVLLFVSPLNFVYASAPEYGSSAITLYELGVLTGTDQGFELERPPTRLEGLIILIKLLGKEAETNQYNGWKTPFSDVPQWGNKWVAYAYNQGLTMGVDSNTFGSSDFIRAKSYMTFVLKALEYNPDEGDFTWDTALDKALDIGLIGLQEKEELETKPFLRDHLALLSQRALEQPIKGERVSLIENLVFTEAIEREPAEKAGLISKDEIDLLLKFFVELPEDTFDVEEASEMIDRMKRIPENYIEWLIEDGTRIRLINNPMTEEPEYEHLKGVVPRGWEDTGKTWDDVPGAGGQLIVARIGYSDPGEYHGSHNLELHEIGHQIDFVVFEMYDRDSTNETFAQLTETEESLFSGAYYKYDEEYFAEAFTMFYLSEETNKELKRKAPKVYEYFRSFEEEYGYDE